MTPPAAAVPVREVVEEPQGHLTRVRARVRVRLGLGLGLGLG